MLKANSWCNVSKMPVNCKQTCIVDGVSLNYQEPVLCMRHEHADLWFLCRILFVCITHAHYSLWHARYCPLILFIENWTHDDGDCIPTCSRDVLNTASSSTSTAAKTHGIHNRSLWSDPWTLRCLFMQLWPPLIWQHIAVLVMVSAYGASVLYVSDTLHTQWLHSVIR